ncbi:cytidylate kinase [Gigaspora margarita]|uniref:(d)CMP kinase n=1 Tax=Gigaspora margarita TaxID=4874 RepID=A0A8H4EIF3_GIGMA|nr:cytidylate kinase [Gigaspora margarita]
MSIKIVSILQSMVFRVGLFYQYIADQFYLDDTIQLNEIYLFKNEMIENKGYVVVGHDATTKILPSARVKLVLEADFEIQVYRRAKQLNAKEFETIRKVFSDLLKRNVDSFNLVLEAKKVDTVINTSNLSIKQLVLKILSHVLWAKYGDNNMLHLIIFILFVFVYTLYTHFLEKN